MTKDELVTWVEERLPNARVAVTDMTGGGDHYEIHVVSEKFQGLNLVSRHRLMHEILEGPMASDVHAVKFKTQTPEEYSR